MTNYVCLYVLSKLSNCVGATNSVLTRKVQIKGQTLPTQRNVTENISSSTGSQQISGKISENK